MESFLLLLLIVNVSVSVAGLSPNDTKLIFYYGPGFEDSQTYELTDAAQVMEHPNFVHNETHIYIHAWYENQSSESISMIVDAYYKRNTINILTLDWAVAADQNYLTAALVNIEMIAPQLADMFLDMYAAGLDWESFTVVGHSLGAQLAGMAGREIIKKTNGSMKLYQLGALEPAFLLFAIFPLPTVNSNDAEFVQVIHTDAGTFGYPFESGHVDFWPNGGRQGQPGCPQGLVLPFSGEDGCNHHRAYQFWAESVADIDGPYFWAFSASSYDEFLDEDINDLKDQAIQMGINCPRDARGNYFLKTNADPPYAKGFQGYCCT